jgi:recombination associated protein RdgC
MFFRNLTCFRFPAGIESRFADLPAKLCEHALRPCGPLELQTRGWVSPYGRGDAAMVAIVGDCHLLALGGEDKILPTAVLNQHIAEKVEEIELSRRITGHPDRFKPVGARERRKLKDDALTELLPRALARPSRLAGYVDLARGWVVVDTSSRKAAEGFVSALRNALGSFPATSLEPEESPRALMTEWLINSSSARAKRLLQPFAIGDECVLKDPADNGAIVKCSRQDMASDEVREHLKSGKQVTALALTFQERMRFVLDETLTIRKFKLLDIAVEQLDQGDRDSAAAELDARFALMSGEVGQMLDAIETTFGVYRPTGL